MSNDFSSRGTPSYRPVSFFFLSTLRVKYYDHFHSLPFLGLGLASTNESEFHMLIGDY